MTHPASIFTSLLFYFYSFTYNQYAYYLWSRHINSNSLQTAEKYDWDYKLDI